jgi:hypothetical protein
MSAVERDYSGRLDDLALAAYRSGLISLGKLADLSGTDAAKVFEARPVAGNHASLADLFLLLSHRAVGCSVRLIRSAQRPLAARLRDSWSASA